MGKSRTQSAHEKRYNPAFNAEGLRVPRSHVEAVRHSEGEEKIIRDASVSRMTA